MSADLILHKLCSMSLTSEVGVMDITTGECAYGLVPNVLNWVRGMNHSFRNKCKFELMGGR